MKHAVVEIRDLAFAWPGHEAVLDLPALRIHEGERVFIKGPSGCGKSTLLGLLAGIQTANHGTLEVLGQPLAQLSGRARDHFRAANLGYIFQHGAALHAFEQAVLFHLFKIAAHGNFRDVQLARDFLEADNALFLQAAPDV